MGAEPGADGEVVRASGTDLEVLSGLIAEAFFDLPPSRWLVPDRAARREIWPGYFRIYVQHALAAGVVHTTPSHDAAALWLPVGQAPPAPPEGYATALTEVVGPHIDRFRAFDAALDARHPAGFAHHHLAILAVRTDRQGRGTGTALLEAHHRHLDSQIRLPAYLEASSQRTRQLYLRRGYTDHGVPIRLPGGPSMFPMIRMPQPAAAAPEAVTK